MRQSGIRPTSLLILGHWLWLSLGLTLAAGVRAESTSSIPLEAVEVVPAAPSFSAPVEPVAPEAAIAAPDVTPPAINPVPVVVEPGETSAPSLPQPVVVESSPNSDASVNQSDYLTPQEYQLVTTTPKRELPQVILSERSSGCNAALLAEQAIPAHLCEPQPTRATLRASLAGTRGQAQTTVSGLPEYRYSRSGGVNDGAARYPGSQAYSPNSQLTRRYQGANPLQWLGLNGRNMLFPLSIPVEITSAFGWRLHPISGNWRFHTGTDLGAPMGTPVLAVHDGQVQTADYLGGYGLTVILSHNRQQQETLYAHLSEIVVRPGQQVKQGEVIGLVGSTGNSTGPHLHFEILQATREGMVPIDPGTKLEFSLAQLIRALQTAQIKPQSSRS